MSLFRKTPSLSAPLAAPTFTPPRGNSRGDRTMAERYDTDPVPEHRIPAKTLDERRPHWGLTNARVLNRTPDGCAFKLRMGGWFDLQGYWCKPGFDGAVIVRRGAPKDIMKLLTSPQKKELARLRLQARRHGLR
jgi:hypothetical protein